MRQLALDLPFEKVDDEVQHLGPDVCQKPLDDLRPDQDLFSAVLDGCKHVPIPWHRKQSASTTVQPLEILSFSTIPGPGSEWASFGLARFPAEIEVTYSPRSDDRFIKTIKKGGSTRWEFDWDSVGAVAATQRPQPLGVSRRREVPREAEDQDRPWLRLAILDILQDAICQRPRMRRHSQLRQLPPVRHPPARPDRPTADDEGRDQRRGQVRAVVLHGRPVGRRSGSTLGTTANTT